MKFSKKARSIKRGLSSELFPLLQTSNKSISRSHQFWLQIHLCISLEPDHVWLPLALHPGPRHHHFTPGQQSGPIWSPCLFHPSFPVPHNFFSTSTVEHSSKKTKSNPAFPCWKASVASHGWSSSSCPWPEGQVCLSLIPQTSSSSSPYSLCSTT